MYYKGNNGLIKSGSNTIGQIESVEVNEEIETVETTAIGDSSKKYTTTTKGFSGSLTVKQDSDDAGQASLEIGAEVVFNAKLEGDAAGRQEMTGNIIINNITSSVEANGILTTSFSFLGNGDLTKGDIA